MKIFIGANFTGTNHENETELEKIRKILLNLGHEVFIGPIDVDDFGRKHMSPDIFMKKVFDEIKKSDVLLFKHTDASTGLGIEAGFGKSLNKKIITIYPPKTKKKSASIEGISENVVEYSNFQELKIKLEEML